MPIRLVCILTVLLSSLGAQAAQIRPKPGRYTVVGLLKMRDGETHLLVNPVHRDRFIIKINNSASVARQMKRRDYQGLVRAEIELESGQGEVRKIAPVRVRRMPVYDRNLTAIPSGNG